MKTLKIQREKLVKEVVEEEIKLKLIDVEDGVEVIACDYDGVRRYAGHLLRFSNDGTIKLYGSVNGDLGFDLDKQMRIKVVGS